MALLLQTNGLNMSSANIYMNGEGCVHIQEIASQCRKRKFKNELVAQRIGL